LWENEPNASTNAVFYNIPSREADVVFTVPNGTLDFNSYTSYTIGGFLDSDGATIISGTSNINDGLGNCVVLFTGFVQVTNGMTISVTHDDGFTLQIGHDFVLSSPNPTPAVTTTATYSGLSGNLPFQLFYGECCGAPAVLFADLPFSGNAVSLILRDDVNNGDCVGPGDDVNYTISYSYPCGESCPDINDVNIIDELPEDVEFVSSEPEPNEIIDSNIIWNIGTLSPSESGSVMLKVWVKGSVSPCERIRNKCELKSGEQILRSTYEYTAVCGNPIVVDNFNSYADSDALAAVWNDGYYNGTRAVVYINPGDPNHDGNSMRYTFNNKTSPFYSEAEAIIGDTGTYDLKIDPNWLEMGVESLLLWFCGKAGNDANKPMYVKLTDSDAPVHSKTVYYSTYSDMNAIREPEWHKWNIDLADFTNVNLAKIAKITIGFGDKTQAVSDGTVWFEDIGLCVLRCVLSKRSDDFAKVDYAPPGGPAGDCVVDYQELAIMVDDWLMASPPADHNVDVYDDGMIDFKDFAILANYWLEEQLWPYEE
jgi:hypothetical protein